MKNKINISISALLIALIACFAACDNDDSLSEKDRVSEVLTSGGIWNMQSVTVNGTDQTTLYSGLQLSFTESAYTTVKGGNVWPASGTWQFTDETAKTIKRNDDVLITVSEATEKKLVLSLTWNKTTLGAGRTNSIAGQHVFTFTRP